MNRLRVVSWNVKVGRRPAVVTRKLRRIARRHKVDVFLLQEAHGYINALREMRGWHLIVANGTGEARGNPILVRAHLDHRKRRAIRCERRWTGPKAGRHHRGRVFTVADVEDWWFVNVHRTRPGWSAGGAAFREEYDRLLEAAEGQPVGPLVIAGDQNIGTRPRDRFPHSPWALMEAIGGRIVTTTEGRIDYAVTRGVGGFARQLGKYGSDHAAVLFVLTKEK